MQSIGKSSSHNQQIRLQLVRISTLQVTTCSTLNDFCFEHVALSLSLPAWRLRLNGGWPPRQTKGPRQGMIHAGFPHIDQERSMPELVLWCPLQHENARRTREEYVKLQQDITRAVLCLTVCPRLHELFVVLLACAGGAANAQKCTPFALSRHALPKLCCVSPCSAAPVALVTRRVCIPRACVCKHLCCGIISS